MPRIARCFTGLLSRKNSNPLQSEIYSMLLSAAIAREDVLLRITQGSPDCELVYTMLKPASP